MRVACLWVPELPLVAALRAEPQLVAEKLAVVQPAPGDAEGELGSGLSSGLASRQRILGATAAALGVRAGQTLAEARAVCPDLRVRVASPERTRAAAQAALDAAASVTPRLEEAAPGLVYLDATGLSALIGDDDAVARELLRAAERVGLCASVGLAEGKIAALLAARAAAREVQPRTTRAGVGGGALRVVKQHEQRAFLAAIPVAETDASPKLVAAIHAFGLTTLGELARLPVRALSARLGAEGAALHRLARGHDDSHLVARPQPLRFEEGEELEWSAASIEPLLFLWKALLDRLCARLSARGLALAELSLLLRLEGGAWDERRIDLAAPTREVAPLLSLLRLNVESHPPPEGVCAVRIAALPAPEELDQLGLFGPRRASPTQLAACVARIGALVGPERVGQPAEPQTWRPNAAAVQRFAPPPQDRLPASGFRLPQATVGTLLPGLPASGFRLPQASESLDRESADSESTAVHSVGGSRKPEAGSPDKHFPSVGGSRKPEAGSPDKHSLYGPNEVTLASRALRPPRTVEVRCGPAGHPLLVIGEGALGGRVVSCAGPWRTVAEWWTQAPISLDSYDLELAGGLLLRASHEPGTGNWWIESVYD